MLPYFENLSMTLLHGDALNVSRELPDAAAQCIVTSPPYFNLRDYAADGQYGAEATVDDYIDHLVTLFRELRRVLTDDGTFWLNLGDGYTRDKQLMGVPWRVALALQADGWVLRNAVVWHKPNAMPEPVKDRLNCRYETVFLFAKKARYEFNLDAIREPLVYPGAADGSRVFGGKNKADKLRIGSSARRTGNTYTANSSKGKNPGDVWSISTTPFPGAHFATFPKELARRCVTAGCIEGGTVLDPFSGAGTTGLAAYESGRKYIGIDLSREYLDLSLQTRLSGAAASSPAVGTSADIWHAEDCGGACDGCGYIAEDMLWYPGPCPEHLKCRQQVLSEG